MTPESHSGSVLALPGASVLSYTNISVGICLWKLKRIVENKIFCPQLVMCSSCLLFVTFGWSILVQKSESRVLRPDPVSPDPRAAQSVIWLILLIERAKEIFQKIFQKYSIFASQAVTLSISLNSVKIFINISHDKTDWQIGINIQQLHSMNKQRRKKTFVYKIKTRNEFILRTFYIYESMFGFGGREEHLCDYITRQDFWGKKLINVENTSSQRGKHILHLINPEKWIDCLIMTHLSLCQMSRIVKYEFWQNNKTDN